MVQIYSDATGERSVGRLVLQPDADAVLKIDTRDLGDPTLPSRIHAAVQALAAELDDAEKRLDGLRRVATLVIALLFSASTVVTTLSLQSLAWQIGTASAFVLAALVLRWLFGVVMRMLVERLVRQVT